MATPDVNSTIGVDAQTEGAERKIRGLAGLFNTQFGQIAAGVAAGTGAVRLFESAISGIYGAVSRLATGIVGFIRSSIDFNASLETSTKQFTTLIGNADQARAHVKSLFDFAAHTPFESGEIIAASQALRSAGGAALDTRETLTRLGDAAAATGRPIRDISQWVGRLYADLQAGRPFGEAAQRLTELNVITPQTRIQLENMLKTTKDGPRVFEEFMKTLGRFNGAMKEQETTWQGLTSTFRDTINNLSATTFAPVFEVLKELLGQVNAFLGSDEIQQWAKDVAQWLSVNLKTAIAAALDFLRQFFQTIKELAPTLATVRSVFGTLVTVATEFLRAFNALPGPIKAVVAAIGGIAVLSRTKLFGGIIEDVARVVAEMTYAEESIGRVTVASRAWDLVNKALAPGIAILNAGVTTLSAAISNNALVAGVSARAMALLRASILAAQLNIDVFATRMLALEPVFARIGVAVNALKIGLSLLGVGIAGVAAAFTGWQIGKQIDQWAGLSKWVEYAALRFERLIGIIPGGVRNTDLWAIATKNFEDRLRGASEAASRMVDELSGLNQARDVEAFSLAVGTLNAKGLLTGKVLSDVAKKVQEFNDQGAKVPAWIQRAVAEFTNFVGPTETADTSLAKFSGSAGKVDTALKSWKDTFKNATSDMNTLSGAQIEGIRFFLDLGESASETAKIMGVFEHQVEQVKSLDEFNDRLREAQSGLKTLSAEQIEAIRYWHAQGAAIEQISKIQNVYKQEVEAVIDSDKIANDARQTELALVRGLSPEIMKLADAHEYEFNAVKKVGEQIEEFNKRIVGLRRDLSGMSPFDRQRAELADWVEASKKAIGQNVAGWREGYAKIDEISRLTLEKIARDEKQAAFEGMLDRLNKLSSALAQLSEIGGKFGGFVQGIATAIGSLNAAAQAGRSFGVGIDEILGQNGQQKDWKKGALDVSASVLTMVSAFDAATNSGSRFSNTLGGLFTGAQIGKSIGSLFGPIGAMIGQLGGGLVGALVGLFRKPTWKKIMNDVGRDFGVDISEGLAKQIEADAKKIGDRYAATLKNLAAIANEAGGINADNFEEFAAKARDIFVEVQRGLLSTKDASQALGDIFPMLADEIQRSNGIASRSFVELIKLDQQFGTNVKAIGDFIRDQVNNVTLPAWKAFTEQHKSALDRYADDEKKVRDLVAERNKVDAERTKLGPVGADNAKANELDKQWDDLTKKINEATKARQADEAAINSTTIASQKAATGITEALAATFQQLRDQGKTTREALKELTPTIEDIADQLAKAGYTGTNAFNEILALAREASDPIVTGVLDPLESVTNIMKGLSNTGKLTQTMFTGLADQARQAFDTLVATGHGGDEALRLMQPTLQLLWQQQHDFGMETDDATKKMLAEAEAADIVGDKHRSAAERSAIAQERVVTVLEAMARKMGVDLPKAADDMANGMAGAADRAAGSVRDKASKAVDDLSGKLRTDPAKAADDMANGVGGAVDRAAQFLRDRAGKAVDEFAGKVKGTPWKDWYQKGDEASGKIDSSLGGVEGGIDDIGRRLSDSENDFWRWQRNASEAARRVYDSVNAVNFGHSPGGLKEIRKMLAGAADAFRMFQTVGVASADRVKRSVDELSAYGNGPDISVGMSSRLAPGDTAPVSTAPDASRYVLEVNPQIHIHAMDAQSVMEHSADIIEGIRLNVNDAGTRFWQTIRGG